MDNIVNSSTGTDGPYGLNEISDLRQIMKGSGEGLDHQGLLCVGFPYVSLREARNAYPNFISYPNGSNSCNAFKESVLLQSHHRKRHQQVLRRVQKAREVV